MMLFFPHDKSKQANKHTKNWHHLCLPYKFEHSAGLGRSFRALCKVNHPPGFLFAAFGAVMKTTFRRVNRLNVLERSGMLECVCQPKIALSLRSLNSKFKNTSVEIWATAWKWKTPHTHTRTHKLQGEIYFRDCVFCSGVSHENCSFVLMFINGYSASICNSDFIFFFFKRKQKTRTMSNHPS